MKRLLTIICCLFSIASVWAQTSELEGKIISVGSAATTLEAGQWYVLYNAATSAYVLEGEGNTLEAKPLTVMSTSSNSSQLFVPNDSDISLWTFHWIAADPVLVPFKSKVVSLVADLDQLFQQFVKIPRLARTQGDDHVGVIDGVSQTIDTGDRRDYYHIPTLEKA